MRISTWSGPQKALEAKYPRGHFNDEPEQPRRRRAGGVRKVYNAAGGLPDLIVEGRAARMFRDQPSNVERSSGLAGYEDAGKPIEDDGPTHNGGEPRVLKEVPEHALLAPYTVCYNFPKHQGE